MPHFCVPQEITDEIITYLWDDITTLKACASTHPSFLPSSQRQLFFSMSLFATPDGRSATCASGANLKRVLEVAPHLAGYVHSLEINDFGSDGLEAVARPADYQALMICLSMLRNLKTLTLRYRQRVFDPQRWQDVAQGEPLLALIKAARLAKLTSLVLDRFPLALGGYFPTVRHLSLKLPNTDLPLCRAELPPSLVYPESLRLDIFEPGEMLRSSKRHVEWLNELNDNNIRLNNVRALHISTDAREWQEGCTAWPVLRSVAPTLEKLSFEINSSLMMFSTNVSFYSPHVLERSLDWSVLRSLRVLHVRMTIIVAGDQGGLGLCDSLPWLAGLFKSCSSSGMSYIEEMIIQVNYKFLDQETVPHLVPWKDLISQLCNRNRFIRLRKADIMIASESKRAMQCEAIGRQVTKYVRMHNNSRQINMGVSMSHKLYVDDI